MRTEFKNECGTVYLTDVSVIVETKIFSTELKPQPGINKNQFLSYEYRNQVRRLKNLQRLFVEF